MSLRGTDMLGPWWGRGRDEDAVSVLSGIRSQATGGVTFTEGCKMIDNDLYDPANECASDAGFPPDWANYLEVSCSS